MEQLWDRPFLSGDFYKGDLLHTLMHLDLEFWQQQPDLHIAVWHLMDRVRHLFEQFSADLPIVNLSMGIIAGSMADKEANRTQNDRRSP